MTRSTVYRIMILAGLAAGLAAMGRAQAGNSVEVPVRGDSADGPVTNEWQIAQRAGTSYRRLFVVTVDQPKRRQSCRVQSFTAEKLVCSRSKGRNKIYLPQEVSALIVPGSGGDRMWFFIGFSAEVGATIWGVAVLVAGCPGCAVAAGIAGFSWFGLAWLMGRPERRPEKLLYLALGTQLPVALQPGV